MWLANGEMYYIGYSGNGTQTEIVRIDLSNPSNSESIVTIPGMYDIVGLTATPVSTLFRGADITSTTADMVTVNIIDGTITEICNVPKQAVGHAIRQITSLYEHQYTGVEPFLDLDCDDSSLATGSDFNALTFDCFNEGGIAIADTDVVIRIDEFIDVMIFEMVNPLDGTNEIFTLSGSTPGILVDGSGTPTLTLYSEGEASAGNFDYALKQVRYDNLSLGPTGGTRVIQVSFSTQSGSESNFAFAFIEVIELPQLEVDLGPDLGLCNGSSILLEAGAFAIHYLWSTGTITESIEIDDGGTDYVTVSSNNKCPNSDDIEVEVLPDIHITLTGDTSLCSGENATLIISSDATFPVDVEISLVPGSSILFSGIEGVFEFTDIPSASTEYIITDVIPAESSCIILTDDFQIIDVYQEEIDSFAVNVCDGDSVLIAGVWQKQAGVYSYMYETIHGCDSLVNYTLLLLDAEEVNLHEET